MSTESNLDRFLGWIGVFEGIWSIEHWLKLRTWHPDSTWERILIQLTFAYGDVCLFLSFMYSPSTLNNILQILCWNTTTTTELSGRSNHPQTKPDVYTYHQLWLSAIHYCTVYCTICVTCWPSPGTTPELLLSYHTLTIAPTQSYYCTTLLYTES